MLKEDSGTSFVCGFTRLLETGDAFDAVIRNQSMHFALAHGAMAGGQLVKHDGTIQRAIVNFFDGPQADAPVRSIAFDVFFWHGAIMMVAWYLAMIPATMLARYYKVIVPTWFKVRILSCMVVDAGSITGESKCSAS